jgi:hypothetical protein
VNKENQIERRSLTIKELRISGDDAGPIIEGYASIFESWSEELGGNSPFREKVVKGAFAETIEKDDIRCLFNHDPNYVLGRNKSDTLELEEDDKGLKVLIKPPKCQWAKDLLVSVKRGDISQMSFGFACELDKWSLEDNCDVRELLKVKLFDVSLVTYPAYRQTECDVRTIFQTREKQVADARAEKQKKFAELQKSFQ